ncbi:kinesin-like protein KIN-UC isoform X2 [Dendrobium catenatum]|uniref:Kinesin-like protein n=1 Tax=Dendrobium catenatum TaxID=906689 RepID=A0A2I0WVW2_9ASPA|nr:kinesin-like protein KIN-UC isoform X2 [Dendrobium catenatum]PKU79798.1 Armadillo repeat-containing kinesin-like protein 1 [Dendrobium catenatum]
MPYRPILGRFLQKPEDAGRVRVAVRVRPRNDEDLYYDSELIDCLELQPELRRLKLRKNNWSSESYIFDDVFTESASQKRVYEAVAKPVVETVLSGYNGTVMAYGQTGTGKTYTIGSLGNDNSSERGIMVRALEDVLAEISPGLDNLSISYLQLYLEAIHDLLAPDKNNIALTKDSKSGEVCLPGATVVEISDIDQFLQVLQTGEKNRHASNTKMNARSSRSHAILVVHIQRSSKGKDENEFLSVNINNSEEFPHLSAFFKSKLLIIDLAGSERIDESGVDGQMLEEAKFINLSLNSLGKCINALAENSTHIPTRDSKLTRLLSDSFGGTARTSLIITVSPSARHYSQTSSTIMFGQRAMKVVNAVKLKEDYDSESKYRKLECQIDSLTSELEKQQKDKLHLERRLYEREMTLAEAENKLFEAEKKLAVAEEKPAATSEGQVEGSTYQVTVAFNEMEVTDLMRKLEEKRSRHAKMEQQLTEFLQNGTWKFAEATSMINLLIKLENHQAAAVASPRTQAMVIWFALIPIALLSLYFLW